MMGKRKVYHIIPDGAEWKVKSEDASRAANIFDKKADAIDRAKKLAKSNPLGQVIIHGMNGKIQTEYTYGEDKFPPKG
ncbi:MAG: DUF2188 domain-containing protein [Candidatus Oleimmundimicrobium sp.]|nr:DUF2188 domain-containing protein [Candidatus Oleimmundimicrobium sp.]